MRGAVSNDRLYRDSRCLASDPEILAVRMAKLLSRIQALQALDPRNGGVVMTPDPFTFRDPLYLRRPLYLYSAALVKNSKRGGGLLVSLKTRPVHGTL